MLTFQEIQAWVRLTGRMLSAWEAETLRTLSAAYAAEHYAASEPTRPAPSLSTRPKAERRDRVHEKMMAAFGLAATGGGEDLGETPAPE